MAKGFQFISGGDLVVQLLAGQGEISYTLAECYADAYDTEESFVEANPTPVTSSTNISYGWVPAEGDTPSYTDISVVFDLSGATSSSGAIKSVLLYAKLTGDEANVKYKLVNVSEIPITGVSGSAYRFNAKDSFDTKFLDITPSIIVGTPISHVLSKRHLLTQVNQDPSNVLVDSGGINALFNEDTFVFVPSTNVYDNVNIRFEKGLVIPVVQTDLTGNSETVNMPVGSTYVLQYRDGVFYYNNTSPVKQVDGMTALFASGRWVPASPTGSVVVLSTGKDVSWGYRCDGRSLNVVTDSYLFAAIGNAFGGDGVNTFNLPDYRGRVLVNQTFGMSSSNQRIPASGDNSSGGSHIIATPLARHGHTASTASAGSHYHSFQDTYPYRSFDNRFSGGDIPLPFDALSTTGKNTLSSGAHTHSVTVTQTGDSSTHSVLNPYHSCNFVMVHGRI